jgi:hypothetical protein
MLDLSAILTLLQIGSSASDPLIRSSALMSSMCALMSLLYAWISIVRFAMMRKAHKAFPQKPTSVPPSANVTHLRPSSSIEPINVHPQPLSSPAPPLYSPRRSRSNIRFDFEDIHAGTSNDIPPVSQAHDEQEAVQWASGRTGLRNLVLRVPSPRHRPDMRR